MEDEFPMFRAGLILLGVMAAAALIFSLVTGEEFGLPEDSGFGRKARAAAVSERGGDPVPAAAPLQCRVVQRPQPLPDGIREASGLAVSRTSPGVYWTHNDSAEPILFGVDAAGRLRTQVRVAGADVEDWEDVAAGPCPSGRCLFIGDIGDNEGKRPFITIYRVPEPAASDVQTRPAEALRVRYPDPAQDAEALLVAPSGEVYVLTKGENGPVTLYRVPRNAGPGAVATLERVRRLTEAPVERDARITGGSVSPDGRWAAVRTLKTLSMQPLADLVAGRTATLRSADVGSLGEPQGEGVALEGEGAVALSSESGGKGGSSVLSRLSCTL